MNLYLWGLIAFAGIIAGIYWYVSAGNALAAHTATHDSHEADDRNR